jgi:hypothetical protein
MPFFVLATSLEFDGVTSAEKALDKPLYSKFLATQFAGLAVQENWSMFCLVARLTAAVQETNVQATGATIVTDNGVLRCLRRQTILERKPLILVEPHCLIVASSIPISSASQERAKTRQTE